MHGLKSSWIVCMSVEGAAKVVEVVVAVERMATAALEKLASGPNPSV